MKNAPLVSIIIPVYNVEQYIEQCMETVLEQTYPHLDIILVDDGSKDKSPKMCDDYAIQDSRVRVIHKENGGLISAWMAGVNNALGEYLVFVDSDDWIEKNMVEELVQYATGSSAEIICSNYIIEKTEKQQSIKIKQSMKPGIYERDALERELFPVILGMEERRIHCSRCMKLISKELIQKNMQYVNAEVTMGEDLNIMFPAMIDAKRIVILEEGFFYHYRFVDASMVHKYNSKLHEKIRILGNALQKSIDKKINDSIEKNMYLEGLKKEYIFLLFIVLKNELRGPGKMLISRIQKILNSAKEEMKLDEVKIEVYGRANKLLYFIWRKPNAIRVTLGRMAIKVFDRM